MGVMSDQKLRFNNLWFEVYFDYDPFTEEIINTNISGVINMRLSKKNIFQVGNRQYDFENEIKVGYDAFGKETEVKIKEHLLAVYRLIAEGAKDDGLVEF